MKSDSFDDIIDQLEAADDAYFNSDKVLLTDAEYDALKHAAYKMNKSHPYFVKIGSDVRGGKIKLPYPMNGLTQIYAGEIESHWVDKHGLRKSEIVITDKLDGVSCMVLFADKTGSGQADFQIAYSRGNSIEAADISRSVKQIDFPKSVNGCSLFVIRGELIMPEDVFQKKYLGKYTTARALVAGCINRSDADPAVLKDIHFVAYSVVATDLPKFNKVNSLSALTTSGFKIPFTQVVKGEQLSDSYLEKTIQLSKASSAYELDGIVLTSNDSLESIKYKVVDPNSVVDATVRNVGYEISKTGYWKPVVEINPVKLYGTTVTFATGFNGKFIIDNAIGPGAVIKITKSGSVIPYIMDIVKPSPTGGQYPDSTDYKWNDTNVDLMVKDPDTHPVVKFKQILDFFDTLDVELLKETTLKVFFDKLKFDQQSYESILTTMFDLTEREMVAVVGANGAKIHASLHRRLQNMRMPTFLGALKYCGFGFGVRKAKQLLTQWGDEPLRHVTASKIEALHGFGKVSQRVSDGIHESLRFFRANKDYITFEQITKTNELDGMSFVFTGFRDKDLEDRIERMKGKVSSGVSKKTTAVVSAEGDSGSGKCKKASECGVPILTVDEFKDKYNL